MTIKPAKEMPFIIAILFFFALGTIVGMAVSFDLSFLELLPYIVVIIPLSINIWITYARTIEFNIDGCTVYFLWFKKAYSWDMLQTKRYEKYNFVSRLWERGSPYTRGAVFSPHRVRKSIFLKAASRGVVSLFPFSNIYVYFYPDDMSKIPKSANPFYYVVDETTFRKKMDEWNVVLDGK